MTANTYRGITSWHVSNIPGVALMVHHHPTLRSLRKVVGAGGKTYGLTQMSMGSNEIHVHVTTNGLNRSELVGIIAHESVHVARALARRGVVKPWIEKAGEDDEEALAYPVGEITGWVWECIEEHMEAA